MKAVSIVLLLAIIGASLQQAAPTPSCSSSDTNNANQYALKWLESQKVTLNTTPKTITDTNICGGEWAKSGTCCDVDSLKSFIKGRNDMIAGKWNNFIGKLARVRGKLIGGLKKLTAKLNIKDIKDRAAMITKFPGLLQKFKATQSMLPESQAQIDMLKKWADEFENNIKIFKDQGKSCFDLLKRSRAALLCSVCSGAANTFTAPQNANEINIKINLESCRALTNACFPIWKFNFGLTSILQYINVIKNAKKGDKADTKFKDELNFSEAQFTELKNTFAACTWDNATKKITCTSETPKLMQTSNTSNGTNGSNTSNNSTNNTTPYNPATDDYLIKLCKIAFVINKDNGIVEGSSDAVDDMNDDDAEEADKDAAKPVGSRLLQATTAAEPKVGVTVETTPGATTFNSATAESGLTPDSSVSTASAGDGSTSSARIITCALVAITALLAAF